MNRFTKQRIFAHPIGYIGEFEIIDDHRSGKIVIQLVGRINKCGVISPRFNVKQKDIENWINNLLPSRQFGYIVVRILFFIAFHNCALINATVCNS